MRRLAQGCCPKRPRSWSGGTRATIAAAHDPGFCAGDVAAAFLANPTATLDASCATTADYQQAWVLE